MADFTPELQRANLQCYTGQGAFKFWCQMALPIVYDDSLSYYELLNKVVAYLNNTISDVATAETNIENINDTVEHNMDALLTAYNLLQGYVNDYFDNLDVQEEINNKLDEMATSGALTDLLAPLIPDLVTNWLTANVNPVGSAVVVDNSLTVSGAAADAKITGNKIANLANIESNQYQSSQSKNTAYSQPGTTWYTGSNRLVYPTLFTQGKTISQIQLYLFVGQATDSVIRFDFWQGFPNHYSIVKTFRFDIPAKSGEGWRFFNIDYVCAADTRISVFVESGTAKFQISQNTQQEQGCYVITNSTDDNITILSFGNLNAATSIGGSVAVIDSDAFPTCKVLNSGNYGTLLPYSSTTNLPSFDDVKVNVAYAIVKNPSGMNITGYPSTGFLGAQNLFISIVQTPGSHTSGDLQIMRDRNNVTVTRTWSGTAWSDWIFSPRTLVLSASNYRQYLPTVWVEAENRYVGTLDDITENSNIVISYTPTQPAGDPMTIISYPASGFNGAQNLLSTYVHAAGTHTVADLQILRNRNNETATRTWTGSEWSAWVYSPKSPSELNITVDSNLGFAAALKQANNSTAQNVTITVKAGTYDLAVELAEYFANLGSSDPITECVINRDCKIIFESGAEVVCNYSGNNTRVKQQFSIITTKAGSLTLINAKLIGSNIRYCVHDDHESNVNPYTNYYENCNMYLDNSADLSTGVFQFTNCIGNGLGIHGYIEVNGGVFISVPRPTADTRNGAKAALRFHNAGSSNTSALSHIVVKNAYLSSTVGVFSNGSSPLVTPVEVSGCRMVSAPVEGMSTGATIINMSVRAWNNEITN